jgi:hypothetical protein
MNLYLGDILISVPPSHFLKDIPSKTISSKERACFLISQFPTLDFPENTIYSIIIIISTPSSEDTNIIDNLKKKYQNKNQFFYKIDHINKKKFHTYL